MGHFLPVLSRMRVEYCLVGLALFGLCQAQHADLKDPEEPLDDIDEKEFEEYFHIDPSSDSQEEKRRSDALKANEATIKEINKEYEGARKPGLTSSMTFPTCPKTSLPLRRLVPTISCQAVVCWRLLRRREKMRSLRGTLTRSATTGRLCQTPTALLTEATYHLLKTRGPVAPVLPSLP